MDIQRASLVPPDPESLKRELQLQVTPTELKFLDTAAGKVYRLPITLHNLGRTNQKIRFQEPLKPQVTQRRVWGTESQQAGSGERGAGFSKSLKTLVPNFFREGAGEGWYAGSAT